jgi:hypothetical protein
MNAQVGKQSALTLALILTAMLMSITDANAAAPPNSVVVTNTPLPISVPSTILVYSATNFPLDTLQSSPSIDVSRCSRMRVYAPGIATLVLVNADINVPLDTITTNGSGVVTGAYDVPGTSLIVRAQAGVLNENGVHVYCSSM